jgi:hypothetical protein
VLLLACGQSAAGKKQRASTIERLRMDPSLGFWFILQEQLIRRKPFIAMTLRKVRDARQFAAKTHELRLEDLILSFDSLWVLVT